MSLPRLPEIYMNPESMPFSFQEYIAFTQRVRQLLIQQVAHQISDAIDNEWVRAFKIVSISSGNGPWVKVEYQHMPGKFFGREETPQHGWDGPKSPKELLDPINWEIVAAEIKLKFEGGYVGAGDVFRLFKVLYGEDYPLYKAKISENELREAAAEVPVNESTPKLRI